MSNSILTNTVNFFDFPLAFGIDSVDTTLTMETGVDCTGLVGPFVGVIYDATNFPGTPQLDPNKEIIYFPNSFVGQVVAGLVRGFDNTTAVDHNDAGVTYNMAIVITSSMWSDIDAALNAIPAFTALNTSFDPTGTPYVSTDVQNALAENSFWWTGAVIFPQAINIKPDDNFTLDLTNTAVGRAILIQTQMGTIDLKSFDGPANLTALGLSSLANVSGDDGVNVFDISNTAFRLFGNGDMSLESANLVDGIYFSGDGIGNFNEIFMSAFLGGTTIDMQPNTLNFASNGATGTLNGGVQFVDAFGSSMTLDDTGNYAVSSATLQMVYDANTAFGGIGVYEIFNVDNIGICLGVGSVFNDPFEGFFAADTGSLGAAAMFTLAAGVRISDSDGSVDVGFTGGFSGAGSSATNPLFSVNSAETGITATGVTQGTAYVLTKQYNEVTTATGLDGVLLPVLKTGTDVMVANASAFTVLVYPSTGAQIDALGANTAFTLLAGMTKKFTAVSPTQLYSN